jgi:hypothetical protein
MEIENKKMQKHIVAFVSDIFFQQKLKVLSDQREANLVFVNTVEVIDELLSPDCTTLFIIDLNDKKIDSFGIITKLQKYDSVLNIYAFYSHVDKETYSRAQECNLQKVFPRSNFFQKLKEVL